MILLDTSVLIDILRTSDAKLLQLLRSQQAAHCGIVRAELLHGVHTPRQRGQLLTFLGALATVQIPDALWDQVGDHLAQLRAAGQQGTLGDVTLATLAISLGIELWTRDKHFLDMQSVLPALKLFQEPP